MKMKFSSGGGGINIDGIIEQAKAKGVVNAGDFVKLVEEMSTSEQVQLEKESLYSIESISAYSLSENKAVLFYCEKYSSKYYLYAKICVVENNAIKTTTTRTGFVSLSVSNINVNVAVLSPSKFFACFNDGTTQYVQVCTVEDMSIIKGILTKTSFSISADVFALSENRVFVYDTANGTTGQICAIDGTTVTIGTSNANFTYTGSRIVKRLSENKLFVITTRYTSTNSYYTYGAIYNVNDMEISVQTATTQILQRSGVISLNELSENTFLIMFREYASSYGYLHGAICKINNDYTSISVYTDTKLTSVITNGCNVLAMSNNQVFVSYIHNTGGTDNSSLHGMILTLKDTIITKETDIQITASKFTKSVLQAVLLSSNNILIAYYYQNYVDGKTNYEYDLVICKINKDFTIRRTILDLNSKDTNEIGQINVITAYNANLAFIINREASYYVYGYIFNIKEYIQLLTASTDDIYGIAKANGQEGQQVDIYRPYEEVAVC